MELSIVNLILDQIPVLLVVIGALVILTNIIVEVLKKFTYEKIPTNILAVLVALVLTIVAFFALMSWVALPIRWYYVAAAIVVAFMVAYAAMFGFDKLKEALSKIENMQK